MDLGLEGGFEVHKSSVNRILHPDWIMNETRANWVNLRKTGVKTVFANDINIAAKYAWENFFSSENNDEIFHLGSIVDYVKRSQNGANVFPNHIDIVTGGFPCQDFSVAGKRNGLNSHKSHTGVSIQDQESPTIENRGNLYMWMRNVIQIVKPKVFIAENVKGLTNLKDVQEIMINDFRSIGDDSYIVLQPQVLNAARYGVPQKRERVIFMGFLKSELKDNILSAFSDNNIPPEIYPYPLPTHFLQNDSLNLFTEDLAKFVTTKEVLIDLPEPEDAEDDLAQIYYSKAKYLGNKSQGQTEIPLDQPSPTIRSEHHGNIEYRRLNAQNGGKHIEELSKGQRERRLTVRECARIQTFPDNYQFVISNSTGVSKRGSFLVSSSDAYKLIGNAVPPLLAYNISTRLIEIWDELFR